MHGLKDHAIRKMMNILTGAKIASKRLNAPTTRNFWSFFETPKRNELQTRSDATGAKEALISANKPVKSRILRDVEIYGGSVLKGLATVRNPLPVSKGQDSFDAARIQSQFKLFMAGKKNGPGCPANPPKPSPCCPPKPCGSPKCPPKPCDPPKCPPKPCGPPTCPPPCPPPCPSPCPPPCPSPCPPPKCPPSRSCMPRERTTLVSGRTIDDLMQMLMVSGSQVSTIDGGRRSIQCLMEALQGSAGVYCDKNKCGGKAQKKKKKGKGCPRPTTKNESSSKPKRESCVKKPIDDPCKNTCSNKKKDDGPCVKKPKKSRAAMIPPKGCSITSNTEEVHLIASRVSACHLPNSASSSTSGTMS